MNVYLLQDSLPGHIIHLSAIPEMTIMCVHPDLNSHMLQLVANGVRVVLQYDTTYKISFDYYLSMLSIRFSFLDGSPVIILGYMLHSRRHRSYHTRFMDELKIPLSFLDKSVGVIVTDAEFDFQDVFPNIRHLRCWKHLVR